MKRIAATVAAAALCAAFTPAALPAGALATTYVQTSYASYLNGDDGWVPSYQSKSSYNKKGRATVVTSTSYNDGKVDGKHKVKYTYDKKGRMKSYKLYEKGKFSGTTKFTYGKSKTVQKNYNAKGKYTGKTVSKSSKTKYTSVTYDAKGKQTGKYVSTYTKKGLLKSSTSYSGKELSYKETYTIKNNKWTKSVSKSYDDDGKVSYTSTSMYSYSGKYTTEKQYSEDNTLYNVSKYYTEKKTGRQIQVWSTDYYGDTKVKTTYKTTKYKSGKLKGIVKEIVGSVEGAATDKTTYTYKAI